MNRSQILDTAKSHITTDRAATHGEAENTFAEIAGHWNWWLRGKLAPGESLDEYDVAMMMVGFKQARAKGNPQHLDSATDLCGYAALAGEIAANAGEGLDMAVKISDSVTDERGATNTASRPDQSPINGGSGMATRHLGDQSAHGNARRLTNEIVDLEAGRRLWVSVAESTLQDFRKRVATARTRARHRFTPGIYIDGTKTSLHPESKEIEAARRYVESGDFREVCEMAGVSWKPKAAMAFIIGGGEA